MKNVFSKILVIVILIIIVLSISSNIIYGYTQISEAYLVKIGNADYHLKYYNENKGMSTYVIVSIVGHYNDGVFYPAYCTDKNLNGVANVGSYNVDVQSKLQNEKVWRAVKNGYPYKSASELGLSSNWDAYVVTKMAVYCLLGQSNLDLFSADSNDTEAVNMLNCLRSLVNIGEHENEKYLNNVTAEKEGILYKDGEYYSQIYRINSNVELSKYEVNSVNSFPNGTMITDLNGNIKKVFDGEEKFKIKILDSEMQQDINGSITIKSTIKSYPIYYAKTRLEGTQNCVLTANSYEEKEVKIDYSEKLNTGKIILNKKDVDTNIRY